MLWILSSFTIAILVGSHNSIIGLCSWWFHLNKLENWDSQASSNLLKHIKMISSRPKIQAQISQPKISQAYLPHHPASCWPSSSDFFTLKTSYNYFLKTLTHRWTLPTGSIKGHEPNWILISDLRLYYSWFIHKICPGYYCSAYKLHLGG